MRRSILLLSALAALGLSSASHALDDSDRSAGRAVIERQIEAFRNDDAAAAYGLASPAIQGIFPTDALFMNMVRQGYRPVYRPKSFEFGESRDGDNGFDQALRIQDAEGVDWDAVYSLERQPDGSWRVSGCRLVKRPGLSA